MLDILVFVNQVCFYIKIYFAGNIAQYIFGQAHFLSHLNGRAIFYFYIAALLIGSATTVKKIFSLKAKRFAIKNDNLTSF